MLNLKKFISYSLFFLLLMLVGCKKKEVDDLRYRQTVIVYMMAENSLNSWTQGDINEMKQATDSIPDNCRLVIYMDKASSDETPYLMEIHDKTATTIKTYNEQNSCDKDVFAKVIRDIANEYPSDAYSLVMWSHGSGWIPAEQTPASNLPHRTIGIDNGVNTSSNKGAEMEISSMREALDATGIHFNWILFDACFMQCIEVAYELRHNTSYIIGSPAEIPGNGAPYDRIMSEFFDKNIRSSAEGIATDYYKYYKNRDGLVISVINTAELQNLASATSRILSLPIENNALNSVQKYLNWSASSNWYPDFSDMASIMNKLVDTNAYTTWEAQMKKTIPVRLFTKTWTSMFFNTAMTDTEHFSGVSMFIPTEKYESHGYNSAIKETQWWKDVFGMNY